MASKNLDLVKAEEVVDDLKMLLGIYPNPAITIGVQPDGGYEDRSNIWIEGTLLDASLPNSNMLLLSLISTEIRIPIQKGGFYDYKLETSAEGRVRKFHMSFKCYSFADEVPDGRGNKIIIEDNVLV